jgi:hypothetical protein
LLQHAGVVTTAVVTVKETGEVDVAPVDLVAPSPFQILLLPPLALTTPSVALQVRRSRLRRRLAGRCCDAEALGRSCCTRRRRRELAPTQPRLAANLPSLRRPLLVAR